MEQNQPNPVDFQISRTFDAPRDLVFAAWTEADHLKHWWGPKGFKVEIAKLEVRPGGLFHYFLRSDAGHTMWGKWSYREVAPPQRLVFVASFSNENGDTVRAPFSADFPMEVLSTVTFTEQGGRTTVTMHGVPVNPNDAERSLFGSMAESMNKGWTGTLDQLEAYLAKARVA